MEIWNTLKQRVKNPDIVAEDLGIIDEEVHRYVKETGFDCTRVMQFAFDNDLTIYTCRTITPKTRWDILRLMTMTPPWAGYCLMTTDKKPCLNYVNCKTSRLGGWRRRLPVYNGFYKMSFVLLVRTCDSAHAGPLRIWQRYQNEHPGQAVGSWEYRTNYTAMEIVNRNHMLMLNNLYARNCPIINPMC